MLIRQGSEFLKSDATLHGIPCFRDRGEEGHLDPYRFVSVIVWCIVHAPSSRGSLCHDTWKERTSSEVDTGFRCDS